jgi:hypothetical protein
MHSSSYSIVPPLNNLLPLSFVAGAALSFGTSFTLNFIVLALLFGLGIIVADDAICGRALRSLWW